jgi:NAD(P)-dependent dehydrogenase (short-subunit alcohol dehydrogenase family)
MGLEGKRALITGGTAGIGAEAARLFLADGAEEVVIAGRDEYRGRAAVADIGGAVRFAHADVGDLDSVASLARQVGDVDILVNNAGAFPVAPTVDQSVEGFETMFDTNVRGPYFLTKALVPAMLAKGEGSIVNTTTLAAYIGVPGASVYSATKAAIAGLTRVWAAEWSSQGVRVNSIAPGPTITDGVVVEWGEGVKELGSTMPIGRTATPKEIAEAILFLASPRSSYVTGTTLAVDGGGSFH